MVTTDSFGIILCVIAAHLTSRYNTIEIKIHLSTQTHTYTNITFSISWERTRYNVFSAKRIKAALLQLKCWTFLHNKLPESEPRLYSLNDASNRDSQIAGLNVLRKKCIIKIGACTRVQYKAQCVQHGTHKAAANVEFMCVCALVYVCMCVSVYTCACL